MSFSGKNLVKALICFILLTIGFWSLFNNILIGLGISAFLSISLFFDPSKMDKAKKKEERKAAQELEKQKAAAEKEILEKEIDTLDLNAIEGYDIEEDNK